MDVNSHNTVGTCGDAFCGLCELHDEVRTHTQSHTQWFDSVLVIRLGVSLINISCDTSVCSCVLDCVCLVVLWTYPLRFAEFWFVVVLSACRFLVMCYKLYVCLPVFCVWTIWYVNHKSHWQYVSVSTNCIEVQSETPKHSLTAPMVCQVLWCWEATNESFVFSEAGKVGPQHTHTHSLSVSHRHSLWLCQSLRPAQLSSAQ